MNSLRELHRYRDLIYMLTLRDIRVRYKQSIMGIMWAILMPVAIVLAGVVVRTAMANVSETELESGDLTSVFAKSVFWAFFVSSIRFGTNCLIGNTNLVTKIYFPKLILPISAVLGHFFDFLVAGCVLAVVLASMGVTWDITFLWIPILVLILVMLTTGLAVFLSAAGLFFRDVKYLVEIFVMFAIFITPVFYDASMFAKWEPLLLMNPVAPILEGLTNVLVRHQAPSIPWLGYSTVVSIATIVGAFAFFRRLEPTFAECI